MVSWVVNLLLVLGVSGLVFEARAADEFKASVYSTHALGAISSLNAALQYLEGLDRQLELPFSSDDPNLKEQVAADFGLALQALKTADRNLQKYSGEVSGARRAPGAAKQEDVRNDFDDESKKVAEARKNLAQVLGLSQAIWKGVEGTPVRPTRASLRDQLSRLHNEVQTTLDATKSLKGAS